jgi:hypothetical protein
MRKKLWKGLQLLSFLFLLQGSTASSQCYQSAIMSPSPFLGNHDEIFKLTDRSIWQVKYEYEYLYEYFPTVIICPSRNLLIVDGKKLTVERLSGSGGTPSSREAVIESRIDGEFKGWEGESIYKLRNGQIWQQAEYKYRYRYRYAPSVLIFRKGGSYYMQVDGDEEVVRVRRLN